jgi:hypothetical protein
MRFERELAALSPIDAVYVRRFASGEVDVEVESRGGPVTLERTLAAMPGVESVERSRGVVIVRTRPEPTARG